MVGAQVAAYFPEADAAAYFELDAAAALAGLIEVLAAPARLPCDSKGPLERAPFDQYSAAQPVSAFSCAHGSVSPITQFSSLHLVRPLLLLRPSEGCFLARCH